MRTNRGVLFAFMAGLLFLSVLSLVLAAQPDRIMTGKNVTDLNETLKEVKNMTFGQCVSQNVVIKNDCYSSVKDVYFSCKNSSSNVRACSQEYKIDKAQCKKDFKAAKKECNKIKHNFLESARYSMA